MNINYTSSHCKHMCLSNLPYKPNVYVTDRKDRCIIMVTDLSAHGLGTYELQAFKAN